MLIRKQARVLAYFGVAICCLLLVGTAVPVAVATAGRPPVPVTITWLQSDPAHPALVYTGGYLGVPATCTGGGYVGCTLWAAQSNNVGVTWHTLAVPEPEFTPHAPQLAGVDQCSSLRNPFLLSPNGTDLFFPTSYGSCSAHGGGGWLVSRDGGRTWSTLADQSNPPFNNDATHCCVPNGPLAISPVNPQRLYLAPSYSGSGFAIYMARSDDAGRHWRIVEAAGITAIDGQSLAEPIASELLADPTSKNTVYIGLPALADDGTQVTGAWVRSEDGGATWHFLTSPDPAATTPDPSAGITTIFEITTDRHLPHAIIAQLTGFGLPADRRYESFNHGRTWKTITCPGDLHGQCPAFVLDDVFGSGHAYGFYRDGVHAFTDGGPAGSRLSLSNKLPCKLSSLIDVAGGGKTVLLLCQDPKMPPATGPDVRPGLLNNPNLSGVLYRSADGGRSWQRVTPEISPPIPPAPTPP